MLINTIHRHGSSEISQWVADYDSDQKIITFNVLRQRVNFRLLRMTDAAMDRPSDFRYTVSSRVSLRVSPLYLLCPRYSHHVDGLLMKKKPYVVVVNIC